MKVLEKQNIKIVPDNDLVKARVWGYSLFISADESTSATMVVEKEDGAIVGNITEELLIAGMEKSAKEQFQKEMDRKHPELNLKLSQDIYQYEILK